ACTTLSGSSSPLSTWRLMHHNIEMTDAVEAGVLRGAAVVDHASRDLGWTEATLDDAVALLDTALAVRGEQAELPLRKPSQGVESGCSQSYCHKPTFLIAVGSVLDLFFLQ